MPEPARPRLPLFRRKGPCPGNFSLAFTPSQAGFRREPLAWKSLARLGQEILFSGSRSWGQRSRLTLPRSPGRRRGPPKIAGLHQGAPNPRRPEPTKPRKKDQPQLGWQQSLWLRLRSGSRPARFRGLLAQRFFLEALRGGLGLLKELRKNARPSGPGLARSAPPSWSSAKNRAQGATGSSQAPRGPSRTSAGESPQTGPAGPGGCSLHGSRPNPRRFLAQSLA